MLGALLEGEHEESLTVAEQQVAKRCNPTSGDLMVVVFLSLQTSSKKVTYDVQLEPILNLEMYKVAKSKVNDRLLDGFSFRYEGLVMSAALFVNCSVKWVKFRLHPSSILMDTLTRLTRLALISATWVTSEGEPVTVAPCMTTSDREMRSLLRRVNNMMTSTVSVSGESNNFKTPSSDSSRSTHSRHSSSDHEAVAARNEQQAMELEDELEALEPIEGDNFVHVVGFPRLC